MAFHTFHIFHTFGGGCAVVIAAIVISVVGAAILSCTAIHLKENARITISE
jgi:heme exporter protein D